jgi:hypothetical protein
MAPTCRSPCAYLQIGARGDEEPYRLRMAKVHFVAHRHADQPLCGEVESSWIESSRPESVTCPGCSSRLAGVRQVDEPARAGREDQAR